MELNWKHKHNSELPEPWVGQGERPDVGSLPAQTLLSPDHFIKKKIGRRWELRIEIDALYEHMIYGFTK